MDPFDGILPGIREVLDPPSLLPVPVLPGVGFFEGHFAGIAQSLTSVVKAPSGTFCLLKVSERGNRCAPGKISSTQLVEIDLQQFPRQLIVILRNIVRIILAAAVAEPEKERYSARATTPGTGSRYG